MAESYGWAGKILRVNLTTGEITTQDDEKYHKYIGGMGMAYRIMYEEAPMELDPYDEKALVIFGVGPLTGAGVPCSGRMNVTFRSTWSKGHSIIDAHMGGHIGSMLKYAGYDGIVVSGISEKPVYLRIEDDEVSLEDASDIWGKGTFASNKWMVERDRFHRPCRRESGGLLHPEHQLRQLRRCRSGRCHGQQEAEGPGHPRHRQCQGR